MDNDYLNSPEWSQDDLIIKILEFVCKNKELNVIPSPLIQRDLFPELSENEILHLFAIIKQRDIPQITIVAGNHLYLKYNVGLEEYVFNYKRKIRNKKIYRILEFLSTQNNDEKQSFESGEIAKAFNPELDINEANGLCEVLIANGDVINAPTDQSDFKDELNIVVTPRTRESYNKKKYLEEGVQMGIPVHQTILSSDNTSIIGGSNYGTISQETQSTKIETNDKGLPSWANWLIVIFTILGSTAAIIAAIYLFK